MRSAEIHLNSVKLQKKKKNPTVYLIGTVHYIDAVLVPAEHPALLEEAGDEPQLPVSGPVCATGA